MEAPQIHRAARARASRFVCAERGVVVLCSSISARTRSPALWATLTCPGTHVRVQPQPTRQLNFQPRTAGTRNGSTAAGLGTGRPSKPLVLRSQLCTTQRVSSGRHGIVVDQIHPGSNPGLHSSQDTTCRMHVQQRLLLRLGVDCLPTRLRQALGATCQRQRRNRGTSPTGEARALKQPAQCAKFRPPKF